MNVRVVPLLAAVLPFLAVHGSYLVAATYGYVDWCVPYIESCTSISATGRHPPASYLFRALMLPSAVVMMLYWWLSYTWLRFLHAQSAASAHRGVTAMLVLGVLGCIGLVLYVTVLGEAGDAWARQRRIGTVLFFSFTYLAQLLLVAQLWRLRPALPRVAPALLRALWSLAAILLALGVLTVLLDAWDQQWYDSVEDAFEWVLSLLLQLHFVLAYCIWRSSGWQLRVDPGQR